MNSSNTNGIHEKSQANVPGSWSTGLFDCFSDVPNCCMTIWCPCVIFGRIAEIVDKGSNSCGASGAIYTLIAFTTGCACIYSWYYNSKLKNQYNLPGNCCSDCIIHSFCEPCALCREYRELKNHGFDLKIGWQGNMEKQKPEMKIMAPNVPEGMDR